MYPRMHKLLGLSIEEFLTRMYYYGYSNISKLTMAKIKVLKDFDYVQVNGSSLTEDDIIEFEKEYQLLKSTYGPIGELYQLFETYSHMKEYHDFGSRLDIKHVHDYCEDFYKNGDKYLKKINHISVRIDYLLAKAAMEFGLLDDIMNSISEKHLEIPQDKLMIRAYRRWVREHGVTYTRDKIDYLKDICPDVDPHDFINNIHDEMDFLYDLIRCDGYMLDIQAKEIITGKKIPATLDDLLSIYAAYVRFAETKQAMYRLNIMISHIRISIRDDASIRTVANSARSKYMKMEKLFLTPFIFIRDLITFDGLNLGYLDEIPSSKRLYDPIQKKATSFLGGVQLHIDVCKYMDSKLSPIVYPSFYDEYFGAIPEKLNTKANNIESYHDFLCEKYNFGTITKEAFKTWRK